MKDLMWLGLFGLMLIIGIVGGGFLVSRLVSSADPVATHSFEQRQVEALEKIASELEAMNQKEKK